MSKRWQTKRRKARKWMRKQYLQDVFGSVEQVEQFLSHDTSSGAKRSHGLATELDDTAVDDDDDIIVMQHH